MSDEFYDLDDPTDDPVPADDQVTGDDTDVAGRPAAGSNSGPESGPARLRTWAALLACAAVALAAFGGSAAGAALAAGGDPTHEQRCAETQGRLDLLRAQFPDVDAAPLDALTQIRENGMALRSVCTFDSTVEYEQQVLRPWLGGAALEP